MADKITSEQLFGKAFTGFLDGTDKSVHSTQGVTVDGCPLAPDDPSHVCFPSCNFWRDGRCQHEEIMQEMLGKIPRNPVGNAGDS